MSVTVVFGGTWRESEPATVNKNIGEYRALSEENRIPALANPAEMPTILGRICEYQLSLIFTMVMA